MSSRQGRSLDRATAAEHRRAVCWRTRAWRSIPRGEGGLIGVLLVVQPHDVSPDEWIPAPSPDTPAPYSAPRRTHQQIRGMPPADPAKPGDGVDTTD